ncbi:phenylacetate--CoA ligase [Desulfovibrio litoralis]|uniref:Phenylacetate-coenzyme A ligase n=1 Tax=Desulfovibrio litoralis DSM 11393 TaxID=1121455 RepID=A0A1M7SPL2_9BACT|nr:phenylacetate--CoA ligase [Desulfovibrio litoralis]SHN60441.1 phenylacetate-CoA ligase [Desulfovibrio litoralis DSM 11393]
MSKYRFIKEYDEPSLHKIQEDGLKYTLNHAFNGSLQYKKKLSDAGYQPGDIKTLDQITKLPFTTADDLKDGYPLPLLSVPTSEVVRVHSSSGTTGKRKVLAYTANDIYNFNLQMARCYELAELTTEDRVQICVGYGLWTAGAGFQLGSEMFGALTVPVGPGNLEIQLQLLVDLKTTCLGATASMALLMAEEVERHNLHDQIALKKIIFGAEAHSKKMRKNFEARLGLEHSFDIAGMTEMYGPGTALECTAHEGLHYWGDNFIHEIINPETLQPVAIGEVGELVVTSLRKEAAPLIRYRTRDLTRLLPGTCACGLKVPRHDHILGRSDDMIIVRGVNIYPGQLLEIIHHFPELDSEYQIILSRKDGKDMFDLKIESKENMNFDRPTLATKIEREIHKHLIVSAKVEIVDYGSLPRSFGKSKRTIDTRFE